jgi:glycosyltransferase involved in cell wall biosynthesis
MDKGLAVISIGYGQRLFEVGDPDRLRMEACAAHTHSYDMVVLSPPDQSSSVITGANGLHIHPLSARFLPWKFCKAVWKVRSLIQLSQVPVVVTTQDSFETGLVGWLATRFTAASLNVQEHGDVFSNRFWREESLGNTMRFYLGLYILKQANSVRVVADRIIKTLTNKGVAQNNMHKLPVMVDAQAFAEGVAAVEVREYFSEGSFIFLSVARFVPQKNLTLMLQSFIAAYAQNSTLRLLLVGDGPEAQLVQHIIETSGINQTECIIKVLSWSNDVPALMASVDAYVLSSNYEGWGRVLIEAQCAQLPIVTTDVGCAGEAVIDQVHALVVPVCDAAALTKALVQLSSDSVLYTRFKQKLQSTHQPASRTYEQYAQQWISILKQTTK